MLRKSRYDDYVKKIEFPVFVGYAVFVAFNDDITKSWNARFSKDPDVTDPAAALCAHEDGKTLMLFNHEAQPGTIAHESWHAVRKMLLWTHAELENEVVAYHLGYLVGEIHKFKSKVEETLNETKRSAQRKSRGVCRLQSRVEGRKAGEARQGRKAR